MRVFIKSIYFIWPKGLKHKNEVKEFDTLEAMCDTFEKLPDKGVKYRCAELMFASDGSTEWRI